MNRSTFLALSLALFATCAYTATITIDLTLDKSAAPSYEVNVGDELDIWLT